MGAILKFDFQKRKNAFVRRKLCKLHNDNYIIPWQGQGRTQGGAI